MPWRPRTRRRIADGILLRILGQTSALTDFTAIATIRMLVESYVEEFASLERGVAEAQRDYYLQSARGEQLRRRIRDYGLDDFPDPLTAYGQISVTVTAPTNIAPGTVVRTDPQDGSAPKRYRVRPNEHPDDTLNESDGSWHVEDTRDVDVVAVDSGALGNTSAGTITVDETPIQHLADDGLTNVAPIDNGRDALTDAETWQFFKDYLLSLTRGTRGALQFALRNFVDSNGRRVHSAAFEDWGGHTLLDGAGHPVALRIYIDEGSGTGQPGQALADPGLVAAVQQLVDGDDTPDNPGWRADGNPTAVLPATAVAIAVTVAIEIDHAFTAGTVVQSAREAILTYFSSLPVAGRGLTGELQGQLSLARLFNAVDDVPGVLRASFVSPRADVAVPIGHKAVVYSLNVVGQVVNG